MNSSTYCTTTQGHFNIQYKPVSSLADNYHNTLCCSSIDVSLWNERLSSNPGVSRSLDPLYDHARNQTLSQKVTKTPRGHTFNAPLSFIKSPVMDLAWPRQRTWSEHKDTRCGCPTHIICFTASTCCRDMWLMSCFLKIYPFCPALVSWEKNVIEINKQRK